MRQHLEHATLTPAMEDYLRAIATLATRTDAVTVQALAANLGVAAPSVTQMLKRLGTAGLISHEPYQTVVLTPVGQAVARELCERYRLVETYLVTVLGYAAETAPTDADRLEHACSRQLRARMAARLAAAAMLPQ